MLFELQFSLRNFYESKPDLFDNLTLPEPLDKGNFISVLMLEYGSMGVAHFLDDFPLAIALWSKRRKYTIETLYRSTVQQYSPIENYDRYEDMNSTKTDSASFNSTGTTGSQENSAGFDSTQLKPTSSVSGTSSGSGSSSASETIGQVNHIHGNIGVTTAMQMLAEDRRIAMFDCYAQIARIFALDNLIAIY